MATIALHSALVFGIAVVFNDLSFLQGFLKEAGIIRFYVIESADAHLLIFNVLFPIQSYALTHHFVFPFLMPFCTGIQDEGLFEVIDFVSAQQVVHNIRNLFPNKGGTNVHTIIDL
ncbi:hypothetical protein D3C87_1783680 [compost metagenome]